MLIVLCGALKLSFVDHGVLLACRARMSLLSIYGWWGPIVREQGLNITMVI